MKKSILTILALLLTAGLYAKTADAQGPVTFTAAADKITLTDSYREGFTLQLSSITGTVDVQVQGSLDNIIWQQLPMQNIALYVPQVMTATANGTYTGSAAGFRSIRAISTTQAAGQGIVRAVLSWGEGIVQTSGCSGAVRYHSQRIITATTGTVTYTVCSPTATGKRIRLLSMNAYSAQATVSGGALVYGYLRTHLTGLTLCTSVQYLPNSVNAAEQITPLGNYDTADWGACGYPMPVNEAVVCNISANLTNGVYVTRAIWIEE